MLGSFLNAVGAYPVNRSKPGKNSIALTIKLLTNHQVVMIFPQGTRRPEQANLAQPGVKILADRCGALIVPMTLKKPIRPFRVNLVWLGQPIKNPPDAQSVLWAIKHL